jgi:hypothetical protein
MPETDFSHPGGREMNPTSGEASRRLELIEFRPMVKGALVGFATVRLPIGLIIADIPILVSFGKAWASMPSKPQLTADGTPRRGADGKVLYVAILRWQSGDLKNRFSDAVIALVRQHHPNALGGAP